MTAQYEDEYEDQTSELGEGELSAMTALARQLESIELDISNKQDDIKRLEAQRKHLSETVIPAALEKLGIGNKLPLRDGGLLVVKDVVTAGIAKDRQAKAFAWLREHGHGNLIKRQVKVQFGRGQDNLAGAVVDDLRQRGLQPEDKEEVNYQTLGAFVREKLAAGEPIPMDLLGVNQKQQASVTRK